MMHHLCENTFLKPSVRQPESKVLAVSRFTDMREPALIRQAMHEWHRLSILKMSNGVKVRIAYFSVVGFVRSISRKLSVRQACAK